MNIIKYNVWYARQKKMIEWEAIAFIIPQEHPHALNADEPEHMHLAYVFDQSQKTGAIFLAYTGMHDKHNTEIYDGHIIRLEETIVAEVYYEPHLASWQLRNGGKVGGMLGNWNPGQLEIIGNKYEHSELLDL